MRSVTAKMTSWIALASAVACGASTGLRTPIAVEDDAGTDATGASTATASSMSTGTIATASATATLGSHNGQPIVCCPPDPHPGCCMYYGGSPQVPGDQASCPRECDGIPIPTDPGWKLVPDEDGCPFWIDDYTSANPACDPRICGNASMSSACSDAGS